MNTAVFARVNRMTALSAAERMVLVDLCAMPSETVVGHVAAAPAQAQWARQLGIGSRTTLSAHIQALVDAGVIRVIKNGPSAALYEVMPVVFDGSVPPHRVGRRRPDVAVSPQQAGTSCPESGTTSCPDSGTTSGREDLDVAIPGQQGDETCPETGTTSCPDSRTTSVEGDEGVLIPGHLGVPEWRHQEVASRARAEASSSSASSSSSSAPGDSARSAAAASSSELALRGQRAAAPATLRLVGDLITEFDTAPLSRWQIRRLAEWEWQGVTVDDYRMAFMRLAEMGAGVHVPFRYLETVLSGRLRERDGRAPPGPDWGADGLDDEGRDDWEGWYRDQQEPAVVELQKWKRNREL